MSNNGDLPAGTSVNEGADASSKQGSRRYDPAFDRAVKAGLLTPFEAYSRGKREPYAMRLVERFGLSQEQAFAVADNEMTLIAARGEKAAAREELKTPVSSRGKIYALALVLVVIAAGLLWWRAGQPAEQGRAEVKSVTAGVHTDDFGDVTRVVGESPQQVLARFCGAEPEFAAQGLMASNSGAVPVRIGVLHKTTSQGELLAIPIREDRQTGQWFAGDGRHAVVPVPAPPGASQASWPAAR